MVLGIVPTIMALNRSIVNRSGISLQGTGVRFKSLRIESISNEIERGNKLISVVGKLYLSKTRPGGSGIMNYGRFSYL